MIYTLHPGFLLIGAERSKSSTRRQAYDELDAEAVVALYTDDAYYLSGGDGPIRGAWRFQVDSFSDAPVEAFNETSDE